MNISHFLKLTPVYSTEYVYKNHTYIAESRVDEYDLVFGLYPSPKDPFYTFIINRQYYYTDHAYTIRHIENGEIEWHKGDEYVPILQGIYLIANDIAKQTNELLLRAIKLKAFI